MLAAVLLWGALAGCYDRPARTPAAAYECLAAAVNTGDAAVLYRALDQPSRWSVISTQQYYRQILELVEHRYPAEARSRELGRIAGADRRSPAAFFAAQNARRGGTWLGRLGTRLGPATRIEERGATAVVHADGGQYEFQLFPRAGWGYTGLRAELEELKRRASHDVETARENAKIFERAGGSRGEDRP
jgi:hypothetical protein